MSEKIAADRAALLAELARRGFDTAAKFLSDRDRINYRTALSTWARYPSCMDGCPKELRNAKGRPSLKNH